MDARAGMIMGVILYVVALAVTVLGVLEILAFRVFEGIVLLGTATALAKIGVDAVNGYIAAKILCKDNQQ